MNVIQNNPFPAKQLYVSGSTSTNGNLVNGPGVGYELVVSLIIIQNTTTSPTTVTLKAGAANILTILAQNQGDGLYSERPRGKEFRCGDNNGLFLALSAANIHNYTIAYWVEATQS